MEGCARNGGDQRAHAQLPHGISAPTVRKAICCSHAAGKVGSHAHGGPCKAHRDCRCGRHHSGCSHAVCEDATGCVAPAVQRTRAAQRKGKAKARKHAYKAQRRGARRPRGQRARRARAPRTPRPLPRAHNAPCHRQSAVMRLPHGHRRKLVANRNAHRGQRQVGGRVAQHAACVCEQAP